MGAASSASAWTESMGLAVVEFAVLLWPPTLLAAPRSSSWKPWAWLWTWPKASRKAFRASRVIIRSILACNALSRKRKSKLPSSLQTAYDGRLLDASLEPLCSCKSSVWFFLHAVMERRNSNTARSFFRLVNSRWFSNLVDPNIFLRSSSSFLMSSTERSAVCVPSVAEMRDIPMLAISEPKRARSALNWSKVSRFRSLKSLHSKVTSSSSCRAVFIISFMTLRACCMEASEWRARLDAACLPLVIITSEDTSAGSFPSNLRVASPRLMWWCAALMISPTLLPFMTSAAISLNVASRPIASEALLTWRWRPSPTTSVRVDLVLRRFLPEPRRIWKPATRRKAKRLCERHFIVRRAIRKAG
mmetsp:Transcript_129980/g.277606  ORF Transcript_129980/g.277606 Transcript_129980/m.277606 type:complete len:360 (+) Transcript_129980:1920-2999(+)